MRSTELMERIASARPLSPMSELPATATELLDDIIANRGRRPAGVGRPHRRAILSAATAAGVGLLATASVVAWPASPSAAAQVARAARATAAAQSGRATMQVSSSLDGKPNNGTVELAWEADRESYVFDYPETSGHFETRIVGERIFQRGAAGAWREVTARSGANTDAEAAANGGLASVSTGFTGLTKNLHFEDAGGEGDLRHYRAVGDLSSLDRVDAGFVFGTNGVADATTSSLDVWVDAHGLIRRVRSSFSGSPDGHRIDAVADTELRGVGAAAEIASPLP